MSRVSPELLQKIKDAVNLVDVVSEQVVLKKTGANYSGLCPFHSERSPSFSVHEGKQLYHCYGCKAGGDLVDFVKNMHGLSFPEAIEDLAQRARIPLPKDWAGGDVGDPAKAKLRDEKNEKIQTAFKLNRFAAAFYHAQLAHQRHIAAYFRARGLQDQDLTRSFYIGAAPAGWDSLSRHLHDKKAPLPLAIELGLIRNSQPGAKGIGYFDLFRSRAMFPILDTRGRVTAFGGRSVPPPEGAPDSGSEGAKYMNSPDSLLFHKSKVVFGLFQAGKHIRDSDEVIVVEGYFDVMALHAAGFQNVVATCGTALTTDHLALLGRFAKKVIILFDGDRAGQEATERAMEVGLDQGAILYSARLPDGLDPDEILFEKGTGKLLERGKLQIREILARTAPILDQRVAESIGQSTQGPEAKTQAVKAIGAWLSRYKDPVGREVRLAEVAQQLGVPRELLVSGSVVASKGGVGGPVRPVAPAVAARPGPVPAPRSRVSVPTPRPVARKPQLPKGFSAAEKVWLKLLAHPEKAQEWIDRTGPDLPPEVTFSGLFEPPARDFVTLLVSEPSALTQFASDPTRFFGPDFDPVLRSALAEAFTQEALAPADEEIQLATHRLLSRTWARFSQSLRERLAAAEAQKNMGLHAELMKEYLDVQRRMQEFSSFYDEA